MRKIIIVPEKNKEELRKHFNEYLTKLFEYVPHIQFDENGLPIYKWFDYYWTDKKRIPYSLIIDNKFAGFCLMREIEDCKYEISEFYVHPNFRKDGNAQWFAMGIIDMFTEDIELSTSIKNLRAINFWTKVTNSYDVVQKHEDDKWKYWTIKKMKKIEW